jgi:hypothetical protein
MLKPKKPVKKSNVTLASDEKLKNSAKMFIKGFTDSVVPSSKNVRKVIEGTPEYKVVKGVKSALGYKKGGMIKSKKKK